MPAKKAPQAKAKKIVRKIVKDAVAETLAGIKPESLRSWEQLWADAQKIPHQSQKPPTANKSRTV